MHLLDRYALSCGVKIDKPFILEQYYPMVLDKYVVFQTSGKGNSRQYDYWDKVFSFIREYCSDYKIVHVGLPSDQTVEGVDEDLRGKTSIRQLAYVIKNSSLYLTVNISFLKRECDRFSSSNRYRYTVLIFLINST